MLYVSPTLCYPAYHRDREDFTDEKGVFNIEKAEEHETTINHKGLCELYHENQSGRDRCAFPDPPNPHIQGSTYSGRNCQQEDLISYFIDLYL